MSCVYKDQFLVILHIDVEMVPRVQSSGLGLRNPRTLGLSGVPLTTVSKPTASICFDVLEVGGSQELSHLIK